MQVFAYTEDQLVEQPTVGLFAELDWTTVSATKEVFGPDSVGFVNPDPDRDWWSSS